MAAIVAMTEAAVYQCGLPQESAKLSLAQLPTPVWPMPQTLDDLIVAVMVSVRSTPPIVSSTTLHPTRVAPAPGASARTDSAFQTTRCVPLPILHLAAAHLILSSALMVPVLATHLCAWELATDQLHFCVATVPALLMQPAVLLLRAALRLASDVLTALAKQQVTALLLVVVLRLILFDVPTDSARCTPLMLFRQVARHVSTSSVLF